MKPVVYNRGGHVAHVSVKIDTEDSFDAFVEAAAIARKHGGNVEVLYNDDKAGSRSRVGGVERAGLLLEFGTFAEQDELSKDNDRLRSAIEDYLLWEPRRAGHAEAHRKLANLLKPKEDA